MKKHNIDKIHQSLFWKKKKYFFKSFFAIPKILIVDFIPINNISSVFCTAKITLEGKKKIQTYLPTEIGKLTTSLESLRSEITAYSLKNVMVVGDSSFFLTHNKKHIFYEKLHQDNHSAYLYNTKTLDYHSASLARVKNFPVKKYSYNALYLGGTFTFNYYHFLIEILSKTQYIQTVPDSKNLTVVLDISIEKNENLKKIAEFFLKDFTIQYIDSTHYHQFENLWFITTPNPTIPNIIEGTKYEADFTKITPESIYYLQKVCFENFDTKKIKILSISKVFVARKSKFRKYNEQEILNIAQKYDFKPVYFEDLNIHEQIFVMRNADYIIGASGAAWTNILFSKPKSKGLIWLGSVWGDFSVFSTLAKLVDFDLYHIRYKSQTTDFHDNFNLNPAFFEKQLKQLLGL